MSDVVVYSKKICPYCDMAKELLKSKGISYTEIKVDTDADKLQEMLAKSEGRRTVPQIFIKNKGIGGFDDLKELNSSGKLDEMLLS